MRQKTRANLAVLTLVVLSSIACGVLQGTPTPTATPTLTPGFIPRPTSTSTPTPMAGLPRATTPPPPDPSLCDVSGEIETHIMFFGGTPPAYLEGPVEFTVNTEQQPYTVAGQGNISGEWVGPNMRVVGDFDVTVDGQCVITDKSTPTLSLDLSLDGTWTFDCPAPCPAEPMPYQTEHGVELPVEDGATFETPVVRYILRLHNR
jgi:hypothetical protein